MKFSIKTSLIGTAAFISMTFASPKMREIYWGHTIYYSLGILFLIIGAFLIFRLKNKIEKANECSDDKKILSKRKISIIITIVVLMLFVMFAATNGISAISIFLLPMITAIVAGFIVDANNKFLSKKCFKSIGLAVLLGGMTVLGIFINNAWKGDLTADYQDAYSTYSPISEWKDHVIGLPEAWMNVLGVRDLNDELLFCKEGIINLLYIFSAIIIAVIPIIASFFMENLVTHQKVKL